MTAISVFTPSHNPRWLAECWQSLEAQTFSDFEWIVVLNGGVRWDPPDDPRIRVSSCDNLTQKVGALKSYACSLARSDYLVELDHDDLLTVDALEEIHTSFEEYPGFGLVYSDTAQINEDGSRNDDRFAEGNGWRYYEDQLKVGPISADVQVFEAQAPTPHNVSYIWYAPNHVRAFRRSVYESIAGYNVELIVCDDADLICRMYQAAPFFHIPRCLYAQRVHPGNTQSQVELNPIIQSETMRLYDQHIGSNALVWAEREGLVALDLGGAHNCPEGYLPIDKALTGRDVLDDLDLYGDDTIGVIRATDFLEHVVDKIALMNEIYRVLAPGGMFLSLTPSTDGRGAFCDPTHVSFWNELSFRYYCEAEYQKYVPEITARFRQSRLVTYNPTPWHEANKLPYVCFNATKD